MLQVNVSLISMNNIILIYINKIYSKFEREYLPYLPFEASNTYRDLLDLPNLQYLPNLRGNKWQK